MKKIFFDSDNNMEILSMLENIKTYDVFLFEYLDTVQRLSGVLIIVDDKLLMVKARKFKEESEKWSIPKGKIDKMSSSPDNALKELEEETGIKLPKNALDNAEKTKVYYKKSGKIKELVTFIVRLKKEDLNVDMNKKWEVSKKYFDTDEVYKAKFFSKKKAIKKIETGQMSLLKFM